MSRAYRCQHSVQHARDRETMCASRAAAYPASGRAAATRTGRQVVDSWRRMQDSETWPRRELLQTRLQRPQRIERRLHHGIRFRIVCGLWCSRRTLRSSRLSGIALHGGLCSRPVKRMACHSRLPSSQRIPAQQGATPPPPYAVCSTAAASFLANRSTVAHASANFAVYVRRAATSTRWSE